MVPDFRWGPLKHHKSYTGVVYIKQLWRKHGAVTTQNYATTQQYNIGNSAYFNMYLNHHLVNADCHNDVNKHNQ